MAVSDQEIRDFVIANADNPEVIASAAAQYGITANQLANAIGVAPTVASGIISGELQPLVGYQGGRQTGEGEWVGQETPYIAAVATTPKDNVYNVFEPTGEYRLTQALNPDSTLMQAFKTVGIPALTAYFGPMLAEAISGAGAGTGAGLNSQLTMAQIEAGLGTPGYGYGAQAAASGLFDPSLIGAGAYTQTSFPYDMADFLAADVQNLYSQVGSNIPAIEQNLIASGVDPLVAADVANTIVLNPAISTYDLTNYINNTFGGGNVYDVNMATQYPTSVLPDAGGLLTDLPVTPVTVPPGPVVTTPPTTTTPPADVVTPGTKIVDPDLAKIISGGLTKVLPGLLTLGGVKALTNKPSTGVLPTQQVPTNSPEYYQAVQQYYNTYMPEVPRDVATPLQQWYDSKYGA